MLEKVKFNEKELEVKRVDAFFMEFPPTLRENLYRYSREALS